MNQGDFETLYQILQDRETMYAYEGPFTDQEVQEWLDRQITRYRKWNFGLWAVILKETGIMIGQCGLTMQPWKETEVLEIGYLFNRAYWHKGYATEAARACKKYAFETLQAEEVCSIIRDINTASQNVAIRNGMEKADSFTKHYRGVDMPHYRYPTTVTLPAGNDSSREVLKYKRLFCYRQNHKRIFLPQSLSFNKIFQGKYHMFCKVAVCF